MRKRHLRRNFCRVYHTRLLIGFSGQDLWQAPVSGFGNGLLGTARARVLTRLKNMAKKIKKAKKRTQKKRTQKKRTQKKTQEIRVVVQTEPVKEKDLEPIKEGGKYMIPKTWLSEKQVVQLFQRTPQQHVYTRPAKGGGSWTYVTQSYVVKVLNYVFGWIWDFEIEDQGREQNQVWVKGRLTVKSPKGDMITKSQFGRADIKFKRGTQQMLDYGNDLKAAASDSLKKCASLLGIASDIYGKVEMQKEANKEVRTKEKSQEVVILKPGQVIGPDGKAGYKCAIGDEIISEAEYTYSMKIFGKPLCRTHQADSKK